MSRCARGTPHQAMPVSPTVGWGVLQAHRATQSWSLDLHPVAREKTSLAPCALSLKAYIIDQLFQGSPPLPLLVERCKNLLYTLTILNIIKLSRSLFSCSFFFLFAGRRQCECKCDWTRRHSRSRINVYEDQ